MAGGGTAVEVITENRKRRRENAVGRNAHQRKIREN